MTELSRFFSALIENQIDEDKLLVDFNQHRLLFKLICKYLEFGIVNRSKLEFAKLEQVFLQNQTIKMVFEAMRIRAQIYYKRLNIVDFNSVTPSKQFVSKWEYN